MENVKPLGRIRRLANPFLLCLMAGAGLLCPDAIQADAWTQDAGHGQVVLNLNFMDISHQYVESDKIVPFGYGGQFRKLEINPYVEFGLNPRTTLVVNAFVPFLKYSNDYGSSSSAGFGDVEAGIRRRFNSSESALAVSGQFTVLLPTYSTDRNPPPGNHQADIESRFMVGRGFKMLHHHSFVSTGVAYRYRNGPPADQFRTDVSWGFDLNRRLMLMTQFFGITGLRNGQAFRVGSNPNLQSDFDLYKSQISLVTRVTRRTRIQVGWVDAFAGRNTGHGETWLFAFWKDF